MTQETTCPACGAPLVVSGPRETVQCTFCGADLILDDEGGNAAFRVVGQPEPQKETLSKPVEGHGNLTGEAQVYPESRMDSAQNLSSVEEPSVPPIGKGSSGPTFQPDMVSSGAAVYPSGAERKSTSGLPRWGWIVGAVLLALILLCVCVVAVFLAVIPNINF